MRWLCRVSIVQIQHRKHVVDHADYMAPSRQRELDHTDNECICPAWQISLAHNFTHVGQIDQIDQIDHDLDHLDTNLPI